MKTPGPSKDELRADSGAVRSALVRPSQDRSRVPPWCSPNPRSYAFSNSLGNGVVGSCGSPGRVTGHSSIGLHAVHQNGARAFYESATIRSESRCQIREGEVFWPDARG